MIDTAALHRDGRLDPQAIAGASASDDEVVAALAAGGDPAGRAALAVLAGERGIQAAVPHLVDLLGDDGVAGRAAAWALARLDSEEPVLAAIENGTIDTRENGYRALAGLAAREAASPRLAERMRARLEDELARAAAGRTGLGEHACRVLAVLGTEDCVSWIQRVIEEDPYTDRFELQRQRKQVENEGRDRESARELAAPWPEALEDDVVEQEPVAAAPPEPPQQAPPAQRPAPEADKAEASDEAAAAPVDWEGFLASPEAQRLDERARSVVGQFGPMLEQLAERAAGAGLADLAGQELAALLLQILPQVLQHQAPQMLQVALSPDALNAYQALAAYLVRTRGASPDLVDGVKLVREQLREQLRATGMLGGPDYSDPDEAPPAAAP